MVGIECPELSREILGRLREIGTDTAEIEAMQRMAARARFQI